MLTKDTGICLRTVNYSDTSQITTIFCRTSGKISAIAKGSKRKKTSFGGPLEVLTYGDIVYTQSPNAKLATLTELDRKPAFLTLRNSLYSMNASIFAAELVNSFTEEHDPNPELFDAVIQFIEDLQSQPDEKNKLILLITFQLKLLGLTGSIPVLSFCANCKNSKFDQAWFSATANGVICRDCESGFHDKLTISPKVLWIFRDFKNLIDADTRTLNEIEKILISHLTFLLHKPPKMAKFFIS